MLVFLNILPIMPLITYNGRFIPLFYYDEGCVDWGDEWDEVCGLES